MREDDGTILLLDEATQQWDLWDIEVAGPMPPPHFAEPGGSSGAIDQPWFYSERLMRFAFTLFLVLGITMILTQAASSWYFFDPPSFDGGGLDGPDGSSFYRTITLISQVSQVVRAMWEFSLGLVVVATGLAVHRYIRLRKLVND